MSQAKHRHSGDSYGMATVYWSTDGDHYTASLHDCRNQVASYLKEWHSAGRTTLCAGSTWVVGNGHLVQLVPLHSKEDIDRRYQLTAQAISRIKELHSGG